MKLYIVQHGAALSKEEDPDRPLSEQGEADVQSLAGVLAKAGVSGMQLFHSTKPRAGQTARILAEAVNGATTEVDGLGPKDPVVPWVDRVVREDNDLAIVGHQPFVGHLATRLLIDHDDPAVVAFEPGAALCLEHQEDGWAVRWMIGPSLLRGRVPG